MSNFILNQNERISNAADGDNPDPGEVAPGNDPAPVERPDLADRHEFGRDEANSGARDAADGTNVMRLNDVPAFEENDKRSRQPLEHGLGRDRGAGNTGAGESLDASLAPADSNWEWGVGTGVTGGLVFGAGVWGAAQVEARATGKLGGGGFVGWGGIGIGAGRGPSFNLTWDRTASQGNKPSVCGASLLITTPLITVQINKERLDPKSAVSQVQIGVGVTFGLGVIGGFQCSETFRLIDEAR